MATFLVFIKPGSMSTVQINLRKNDYNVDEYFNPSGKLLIGETKARNKELAILKIAKETDNDPKMLIASELVESEFDK